MQKDIVFCFGGLRPSKVFGLVAQLNSASDYGSEGYWFESSRGHDTQETTLQRAWFFVLWRN